jgi:hypothetical protein
MTSLPFLCPFSVPPPLPLRTSRLERRSLIAVPRTGSCSLTSPNLFLQPSPLCDPLWNRPSTLDPLNCRSVVDPVWGLEKHCGQLGRPCSSEQLQEGGTQGARRDPTL